MQDLPEYIHRQVIRYLQFSHLWNLSLACKRLHAIVHTKGVCDGVYEQRWNQKRTDTTLSDYLAKARTSTLGVTGRLCCNRWKLEKDENDIGSTIHDNAPPTAIPKKVELDDFDEEILPETDDFGDEIREEGTSVFEEEDFVAYQKGKQNGLWVSFEASATGKLLVEFLENFIDCEPVVMVIFGFESVKIMHQGFCVKEVSQKDNSKARLNNSGFQKYWALVEQQTIRCGRGEVGEDCVIEWKGIITPPTHVGINAQSYLALRYLETSGCEYLDYGLEDSGAEIAFAGDQMEAEVECSNWEFADPISSFSTATVILTAYSENSNAFDITCKRSSELPISVHITPSQIQVYEFYNDDTHKLNSAKFSRMQGSRYGHYWAAFGKTEACVGVGRQPGISQIGKLQIKPKTEEHQDGNIKLSCFKISGPMLCKISNIRILYE